MYKMVHDKVHDCKKTGEKAAWGGGHDTVPTSPVEVKKTCGALDWTLKHWESANLLEILQGKTKIWIMEPRERKNRKGFIPSRISCTEYMYDGHIDS
ncbi:hypothetical protein NC653_024302 [Populus alba x Populus x berolinensis]|uniref:Uncharacterized protein n=1 Tax=Populus alba x Populus x berolinensis TaxID=444605 RepID=A0AAD6Q8F8_9ROSI|nr:hypothetical protein NC653_024302 [Populus alba x Populus x berolinensis]